MNIADMVKLPFHEVYYAVKPLQAKNDLIVFFNDAARIYDEDKARDIFLYFVSTARKFGFQLFFKAPTGFFNTESVEPIEDGYATPDTQIQYIGLPEFKISAKFN